MRHTAYVVCPPLIVANAFVNTTDSNFSTPARVTCHDGFAIDPCDGGNVTADTVCAANGNWSTWPECKRSFQLRNSLCC
jgi:hypothetical protein